MRQDQAKMIATFEQAGAMMGQFAYMMAQYFAQLVNQGFTRAEALNLCRAYQTVVLKSAFLNNAQSAVKSDEDENDV